MSVLTNDDSYVSIQKTEKGKVTNMCIAMDKAEARGEARGEERGRIQGELRGKIVAYADMNLSVTEIASKVGISEDEVVSILDNK